MSLTGGNRNDITQLMPLLDKVPPVAGVVGRPRRRPDMLFADRGYDHDKYRRLLWKRGIRPVIAERGQPHGSGLGIFRWVVERTISWLHGFRRLRIRWERRDDIHEAFHGLVDASSPTAPRPTPLLGPVSGISPHFRPRRHLMPAHDYRAEMIVRFAIWKHITGVVGSPAMA